MVVSGRDLNEWTLIWPDDEVRYTVAVADGHGHSPERGWTTIEVVRAPERGAVEGLREVLRVVEGVERGEPFGDEATGSLPPLPYIGDVVRAALSGHPRGAGDPSDVDRLRAGISWARGMCSDSEPHEQIDAFLGRLLDPPALDEEDAK